MDRPSSMSDDHAWLDTAEILKKPTTAGKHGLSMNLCLWQRDQTCFFTCTKSAPLEWYEMRECGVI
jgi:hypothetical protein